jgi:Kef-type K+ transport system membrane component KefB
MRFVAWFQVVVGAAIAGLWVLLLTTGQVPEVTEGRTDIWFHILAELAAATLLVTAGVRLLRRSHERLLLSALALGALGYTALNSSGYYAERGEWPTVVMFGVVIAATATAILQLHRADTDGHATATAREHADAVRR